MQFNSNCNHPPKCHVSFSPHLETLEVNNGLNKSVKRQYYAKPGFIVMINSSSRIVVVVVVVMVVAVVVLVMFLVAVVVIAADTCALI